MAPDPYTPVRWQAPGRVNLIGEHTDYNGGFVLPFAIDRACTATIRVIDEEIILIRSAQRAQQVSIDLNDLAAGRNSGWAAYAVGVAWALAARGVELPGMIIELDSTVPYGAGLSSSAALTCSVATALNDLLSLQLTRQELLAVTMRAENEFADAPTGGMDQLAALAAVADNALFCDMRSLQTRNVPLRLEEAGLCILIVDTKAEHRNADGEYRQRRDGCELAAATLGVPALRDVTDLSAALAALPTDELRRYTRHIVTENQRVLDTVALLEQGDVAGIGGLLTASHESLRFDFQISISELDVAVAALLQAGALGARMTGGGFGGSVIALIDTNLVEAATAAVEAAYVQCHFGAPMAFLGRPSQGAHAVR